MSANFDMIFMKQALQLAKKAEKQGEVPVGAVLVQKNKVIASAFNQKERLKKATAHAEILAIEQASQKISQWGLINCSLYVTLEPCLMCTGALIAARIKRLVYACHDPKAGAVASLYKVLKGNLLNHKIEISHGILNKESSLLLKHFFQKKRRILLQKSKSGSFTQPS